MIRLSLYQPEIPQNVGTLMRLCACMGVALDVIEPCGFVLSDKRMKRAGMDYIDQLNWVRHDDFKAFKNASKGRIIALDTKGVALHTNFSFKDDDILLLGREGDGLPDAVLAEVDAVIKVPMKAGMRSLNVAVAGAMVLNEALRQTGGFPA